MAELHVVHPDEASDAQMQWAGETVPPGHVVRTGYVPIHDIVCYAPHGHHLLPAEVERAYRRLLADGPNQAWPPPTGWRRTDGRFVLTDGRNRFVASLMLGVEHLLVAWIEEPVV